MKTSSIIKATLVLAVSLFFSQSYAQSAGVAADKNKQANLEKIKAHQADMHKKYNAMTPEQAAEAKKQAREYKSGGYKNRAGQGTQTAITSRKPSAPRKTAAPQKPKPVQQGVVFSNPAKGKPAIHSPRAVSNTKPVLMDANGKPLNKTAAAGNTQQKAPVAKTNKLTATAPAAETIKK